MTMKPQEERAVAACEILLETVNGIEDACQKAGVPFSQEQYCQMFALAYTLLSRRMAGAVTREFALLALAGTMGAEDQKAAQQISDLFTAALARCDGGADSAEEFLGAEFPCLAEAREELEKLEERLAALPAADSGEQVWQAHQVISACVSFVKKAQEEQHRKFTDGKYVQYYAYFLALLLSSGLPLEDTASRFFDHVAKAVEADTPSRRAAMEFKFYRTLTACREQFAQDDPQAADRSLAFVEKGRLNADRMDPKLLQIGRRATEILRKTITDLH